MFEPEFTVDPTTLGNASLDELVATLFAEEKRISARRTTLHRRIDFLNSGGYAHLDASAEQLTTLQEEDRLLSEQRTEIHSRVDAAVAVQRTRASQRSSAR
jgi:hypothetical protein